MSDQPKIVQSSFEIRSVISNSDVEYVPGPGKDAPAAPVLHKYVDIWVRLHDGFDWGDEKLVNQLFKKLRQAEELNTEGTL